MIAAHLFISLFPLNDENIKIGFFALGIAIAGLLNWEDLHDGLLAQW